MTTFVALSPFFGKGVAVIVCALILFVGSIYVLLAAVFGLRMGYLVLAVSFFAWMIIMSALWTFGAGGAEVTMFAYFDKGDVPKYSIAFFVGSLLGFLVHLPFLDRAERKRKGILTGGTAPAWY